MKTNDTHAPGAAGEHDAAAAIIADLATELEQAQQTPQCLEGGRPFIIASDKLEGTRILALPDVVRPPERDCLETFADPESFCGYVNTYKEPNTRLYYTVKDGGFRAEAVIDDFEPGSAKATRRVHTAVYQAVPTEEFRAWLSVNGKAMGQADFAEFLEERAREVTTPSGAEMLEIARTLEVKTGASYRSARREMDGGYNLTYEERHEAKAGLRGDLGIPGEIELALPLWHGTAPVRLEARFLVKVTEGTARFAIKLRHLDRVLRELAAETAKELQTATGIPAWQRL